MKHFLIIIILFLSVCQLDSQSAASVSMLSVNDGLSQGMIFNIIQSRDGFIWIATKDGLNRYDGSRFEVFSPDPFDPFAISGSDIRSLYEDTQGRIWVGMIDKIDIFEPKTRKFYHIKKPETPGIYWRGPFVTEVQKNNYILLDKGNVWKLTLPENILEQAVKNNKSTLEISFTSIVLPQSESAQNEKVTARCKLYTKGKDFLIGTSQGIFRIDLSQYKVKPDKMLHGEIHNIIQDKEGRILVRLLEKSYLKSDPPQYWDMISWDEKAGIEHKISRMVYSKVFTFDQDGYLWLDQDKNIEKYLPEKFLNNQSPESIFTPEKSLVNHEGFKFQTFFFDKSGILWAGTNGFGLIKLNSKERSFRSYFTNTSQRMIVEDTKGNLITLQDINTKYSSARFEKGSPHVSGYNDIFALGELSMIYDEHGKCWTYKQGEREMYSYDASTDIKKSIPWKGLGFFMDKNQKLLSVDENGLYQFDPISGKTNYYPFRNTMKQQTEYSQFFYMDADGDIWIFGLEGLIKAIPSQNGYQFEYFFNKPTDRTSLSSDIVMSVTDDPLEPEKYLWVGTKAGGLNRLDKKTGKFKQYKTDQGLPDNVIYGILAENPSESDGISGSHIWLSSNKGLSRFHVRNETCRNFTIADGLQDNEFNSSSYLKTKNGTMIFGGVKGLTVFHPDSLHFNQNIPKIEIVGLKVNNEKFDISGKSVINLSHHQNLINFDFTALEFTNPIQNQYRYQLIGIDKDWVTIGSKNSIQFANLAPGNYTFKVLGSNNDGIWSEKPAVLSFTIRPPWYGSWWAYGFYIVLLAFGVRQFYFYKLSQRLEHQEKLRLQEMDEFKNRFFTNITHEFRTPLTVILGSSEQLIKDEKDEIKNKKLSLIKRSGENLLRLINQILDLTKLESNTLTIHYIQGDILTYIRYIAESMHSFANAQNILLKVESDQTKIVMDYDPERILQIIHNLLSNAIKFTPSGGKVILRAELKDKWLQISVADSGSGIPMDALPHLFERFYQANNQKHAKAGGTGVGLSLTKELVKAMHGHISVQSTVEVGSTFFVKLPVANISPLEEIKDHNNEKKWNSGTTFIHSTNSHSTEQNGIANQDESLSHILIIEDNADVAEYLGSCLKDRYKLEFAYNGLAGIEKALENIPDIIVSDVMMPIKDGFEVVETLKNDEFCSHIPIVLLTAKADFQSRLSGLRKGADAYLSKPFHQEELLVTIENLLESRRKLQLKYQQTALSPETEILSHFDIEDSFLQKIHSIIEENYMDEEFGLPQLCQKTGMSRSQLFRKLKALTNIAPSDLIRKHRLNKAKDLLKSGDANVAETTWKVGFKDPSYFSKIYQDEFGESPSTTRK